MLWERQTNLCSQLVIELTADLTGTACASNSIGYAWPRKATNLSHAPNEWCCCRFIYPKLVLGPLRFLQVLILFPVLQTTALLIFLIPWFTYALYLASSGQVFCFGVSLFLVWLLNTCENHSADAGGSTRVVRSMLYCKNDWDRENFHTMVAPLRRKWFMPSFLGFRDILVVDLRDESSAPHNGGESVSVAFSKFSVRTSSASSSPWCLPLTDFV